VRGTQNKQNYALKSSAPQHITQIITSSHQHIIKSSHHQIITLTYSLLHPLLLRLIHANNKRNPISLLLTFSNDESQVFV